MGGRVVVSFGLSSEVRGESGKLGAHGVRVGDVVGVRGMGGGKEKKKGGSGAKGKGGGGAGGAGADGKDGEKDGVEGVVVKVTEMSVSVALGDPQDEDGLGDKKIWL